MSDTVQQSCGESEVAGRQAISLGKYLTGADSEMLAIGVVMKDLLSIVSMADHRCAEVVTRSRLALTMIQHTRQEVIPITADIRKQVMRIEDEGGRVVLACLSGGSSNNDNNEGYKVADAAAQRAARQSTKEMRLATLSYVKQAIKER